MGTMGHQLTGKIEFNDKENGIYGFYEIGTVKKKTQDYFAGQITVNGQKLCDVYGNYMGYMDFGGVRYYDVREASKVYFPLKAVQEKALESDSTKRMDSVTLAMGDKDNA
jgi:hypothetical protein